MLAKSISEQTVQSICAFTRPVRSCFCEKASATSAQWFLQSLLIKFSFNIAGAQKFVMLESPKLAHLKKTGRLSMQGKRLKISKSPGSQECITFAAATALALLLEAFATALQNEDPLCCFCSRKLSMNLVVAVKMLIGWVCNLMFV